jgi:cell division protein FtsB
MTTRIFDKSNYKKKTLDTFEILGAYFVDIYYNHLYIEAKKLRTSGSVSSITEGYKHTLNAFLQGVENPKLYKKTLMGIHTYFVSSGLTSISFAECIERITEEFIPQDYYNSVSKIQKTSILKLVISQSNKAMIEKIARRFLNLIIDNHDEVANIRVLQDEFIDVLILEREGIYHRFISTQTKTATVSHSSTQLIETMRTEIKKLCAEKYDLKKMVTNLKKIIIKKEYELCKVSKTVDDLTKRLELDIPIDTIDLHQDIPIDRYDAPLDQGEQNEQSEFINALDPAFLRSMDASNDISRELDDIDNDINNNIDKKELTLDMSEYDEF